MMPKFDANVRWLFADLPPIERFEAAAVAGFAGVECPDPYRLTASAFAGAIADAGLHSVLLNTPAAAGSRDGRAGWAAHPERRDEFRRGFERALTYAAASHTELIHVLAGTYPRGVEPACAEAVLVENLGWACRQVVGTDVTLVIEAQNAADSPAYLLPNQAATRRVWATLDTPLLGLLVDIYHVGMSEPGELEGLDDMLRAARHVQIADVPGRGRPGSGDIDFDAVFDAADRTYDGWIGCEYATDPADDAPLDWMKEIIR